MTKPNDPVAALVAQVRARGPMPDTDPRTELPEPEERQRIRMRAGLSLQQIADALDVHVTSVWNWERGEDGPGRGNAIRYGELLQQLDEATRAAS